MTATRAQQAIVDRVRRQTARDYHRALDDAIRDAEGIADLIPPDDIGKAAARIVDLAEGIHAFHTNGTNGLADLAIELAGEALGIAATLTARKDT